MVNEVFFFFDEVFASIKALFLRLAEVEVETDFRSEVVVKELTEEEEWEEEEFESLEAKSA